MHYEYRNSATSKMERCLKITRDRNFQLFMSVDVKNSSCIAFMPSSVRKVVVEKREGKGQLERIRPRGEKGTKMNLNIVNILGGERCELNLAKDWGQWRDFVNTVMEVRVVPQNSENILLAEKLLLIKFYSDPRSWLVR